MLCLLNLFFSQVSLAMGFSRHMQVNYLHTCGLLFSTFLSNLLCFDSFISDMFSYGINIWKKVNGDPDNGLSDLSSQIWGLYIGWAKIDGQILKAVISIGWKLSCCGSERIIVSIFCHAFNQVFGIRAYRYFERASLWICSFSYFYTFRLRSQQWYFIQSQYIQIWARMFFIWS